MIPQRTTILLLDMQPYFLERLFEEDRELLIRNQVRLLSDLAKKDTPLVVMEFEDVYPYHFGETNERLMRKIVNVPRHAVLKRLDDDAFYSPVLDPLLKYWDTKQILLTGINAHACVLDTAKSAVKKKYSVFSSVDLLADRYRIDPLTYLGYPENVSFLDIEEIFNK